METSKWSELPTDLLIPIARRLEAFTDRASFSGVCRNWSSLAKSEINYLPRNPPWLMLAEKPDSDKRTFVCADGKESFDLELPETRGSRCVGSTGCWLVMVDSVCDMYILNPFSRAKIDLPPVRSFRGFIINGEDNLMMRDHYVQKVILSFPKSKSGDFIAVAIYEPSRKLAYAKNGDKSWQTIGSRKNRFIDVIFYQEKFYTLNSSGIILEFNIDEKPKPTFVPISDTLTGTRCNKLAGTRCYKRFLVESRGEFLQAFSVDDYPDSFETKRFNVFKLDFATGGWIEVNDLGQQSVFFGFNTSVALLGTSRSAFRPNCIYFTDDYILLWVDGDLIDGSDVGVFNLADGIIVPHYTGPYTSGPRPVWIVPTSLLQTL